MSEMIELIKQLRERTGAGMMDCKKALLANNNDIEASITWLREKGIAKQAKKAGTRVAAEGVAWIMTEGNRAAIVELNSETDFVANSDTFRALVKEVNSLILTNMPKTMEEAMVLKNAEGKTISDAFVDAGIKIGEKLVLRRFEVVEKTDDEVFGPYIHMNGKIATLVVLKGGNAETAKGIALNVCSLNPTYRTQDDIPAEVIERETAIELEAAKQDAAFAKKPEAIQKKIVEGKVSKSVGEAVLANEPYVLDESKTVAQVLKEANANVVSFKRYAVGEGIEKKKDDLAEEVAKQIAAAK